MEHHLVGRKKDKTKDELPKNITTKRLPSLICIKKFTEKTIVLDLSKNDF